MVRVRAGARNSTLGSKLSPGPCHLTHGPNQSTPLLVMLACTFCGDSRHPQPAAPNPRQLLLPTVLPHLRSIRKAPARFLGNRRQEHEFLIKLLGGGASLMIYPRPAVQSLGPWGHRLVIPSGQGALAPSTFPVTGAGSPGKTSGNEVLYVKRLSRKAADRFNPSVLTPFNYSGVPRA